MAMVHMMTFALARGDHVNHEFLVLYEVAYKRGLKIAHNGVRETVKEHNVVKQTRSDQISDVGDEPK
jgi:hypothetical protein